MINQYDMVVRQNRELQAELALKDKIIELMAQKLEKGIMIPVLIGRYEQEAKEKLVNASI